MACQDLPRNPGIRMNVDSNSSFSPKLNVLVTGATGHLGTAVCAALLERGHNVRATDLRYAPNFPVPVELGDLRDEHFAYRIIDGCDTIVHLGNHPNAYVGLSPQRIFAENTAMNANVFWAGFHLDVPCLIFASSIQVLLRSRSGRAAEPFYLPYLPLDGDAPADPGINSYAASKDVAERLLRLLAQDKPTLSATSLRFPMLPRQFWMKNLESAPMLLPSMVNLGDAMIHLQLPDAGELVARVAEQRHPGYHQYLPGSSIQVRNWTMPEFIERFYSHIPLRRPVEQITDLADGSALLRDFDYIPKLRASVNVARD
jgi:nucleoside-diphosphate-sugar epimerase